jgi:hypothetical protein
MPKKLYIIFLVLINYVAFAGDSLKTYPKIILGASYSNNYTTFGNFDYEFDNHWDRKTIKLNTAVFLNGDYLINKKSKTANLFYVGLGINYSQYNLIHDLEDWNESGLASGSKTTYSQNEFKYSINSFGIEPNVSYYVMFKKFAFTNKLGVNYSRVSTSKSYQYTQIENYYGVTSNSMGYHTYNTTTFYDKTDKINEKAALNLSYSISMSVRLKKLMPSITFRTSRISNNFNNPYFMLQIGCSYLF